MKLRFRNKRVQRTTKLGRRIWFWLSLGAGLFIVLNLLNRKRQPAVVA